ATPSGLGRSLNPRRRPRSIRVTPSQRFHLRLTIGRSRGRRLRPRRSRQGSRARGTHMPIGRAPRLTEAEVTDEAIYLNRRAFLAAAAAATLALGGSPGSAGAGAVPSALGPLPARRHPGWITTEPTHRFDG